MYSLWVYLDSAALPLQIIALLVNSLHLLVLIRKPLRCCGIFIFMLAICLADITNYSLSFTGAARRYKHDYMLTQMYIEDRMNPFLVYGWIIVDVPGQLMALFYSITRKYSVWLAVVMSAVRTLSVLFPMHNRIQKINEKTVSVRISIAVFIFVMFVDFTELAMTYRIKWLPSILL